MLAHELQLDEEAERASESGELEPEVVGEAAQEPALDSATDGAESRAEDDPYDVASTGAFAARLGFRLADLRRQGTGRGPELPPLGEYPLQEGRQLRPLWA